MLRTIIDRMLGGLKSIATPIRNGGLTLVFCTAPMPVSLKIIHRLQREEPDARFVLCARKSYAAWYAEKTGLPVIPFHGEISLKSLSQWRVMAIPGIERVIYLFGAWWHGNVTTTLYYLRRVLCSDCRIFRASEEQTAEELYYSMDFEDDNLLGVAVKTILSLPIYLMMRLVSPLFLIRIKCFDGAYGDLLQEALSMYAANRLYRKPREFYVSYARRKIQQDFVFKKLSEFLYFSRIARFIHLCTRIFGGYKKHTISEYELRPAVLPRMGDMGPGIRLSVAEQSEGAKILAGAGITSSDRIVCVHVRDSAFFKTHLQNKSHEQRAVDENRFRDWSGEDIIPMARELDREGYKVIKMGSEHPPMPPETGTFLFDYANAVFRSPFMDCYLTSRCSFYIASDSGPSNMANLMRRPLMLVNIYNLQLMLLKEATGVYLKRFIDTRTGRELTLSEVCERDLHWQMPDATIFLGKGVTVTNNRPEEVLQCAIEIMGRVNGTWEDTPRDMEMRQAFNDILLHYFKEIRYGHNFPALAVNAPISTTFLRNHPDFIK